VCSLIIFGGFCSSVEVIKAIEDDWFPLTIIHLNDMHAR
jgi:hypothetical protein